MSFGEHSWSRNSIHLVKEKAGSDSKVSGSRHAACIWLHQGFIPIPRQCCPCSLSAPVRVIGAVPGDPSPEGAVTGGQSSLVCIQLPVYNGVLQPCLYGACLFFKSKKRRKNHHTNNKCQL